MPDGSENIAVQPSPIHGLGGFARVDFSKGARVIEYVGERIDKRESARRCRVSNQCIFYLDDQFNLDGDVPWNLARFLNHSCAPNCEAELLEGRIWIIARRDITAGEEITFNYGYDPQDFEEHPCRCGAPGCVGYILAEEFWPMIGVPRSRIVVCSPAFRRPLRRSA
jgi:hypothetical protein